MQLDRRLGSPEATHTLITLYRLFQGPIATTLDNKRAPFLPVELTPPGQSMYDGVSKQEVDAYIAAHPDERDALLDQRSVVRRATVDNLRRAVEKLQQCGALS